MFWKETVNYAMFRKCQIFNKHFQHESTLLKFSTTKILRYTVLSSCYYRTTCYHTSKYCVLYFIISYIATGQYYIPYYTGQYYIPYYTGQYHVPYYTGQYHVPYYTGQYYIPYYTGQLQVKIVRDQSIFVSGNSFF